MLNGIKIFRICKMKCDDMYFTPTNNLKASGTYPKSRTWCWERSRTLSCWSGGRLKKRDVCGKKIVQWR